MLNHIDRVALATPDADETAGRWISLLGGEPAGEDHSRALGARRVKLRLAQGFVELLEPDGAGPVAAALAARRRAHLFAAGVSCLEPRLLARMLEQQGVAFAQDGDQLLLEPASLRIPGLRLIVSQHEERAPVGLTDFFYEATLLDPNPDMTTGRIAALFGLDRAAETPIVSETFGYEGLLAMFRPGQLHRLEVINPVKAGTTMARQFQKLGPALYMAFAESARIGEIEERARAAGLGVTVDRPEGRGPDRIPDQLWLHPDALGGMMLGVSRPGMAWTWSGAPERVPVID